MILLTMVITNSDRNKLISLVKTGDYFLRLSNPNKSCEPQRIHIFLTDQGKAKKVPKYESIILNGTCCDGSNSSRSSGTALLYKDTVRMHISIAKFLLTKKEFDDYLLSFPV